MHRWIGSLAAMLSGLAALTLVSTESPGGAAPANVDPPDTDYRTGARDPDPTIERRLPVVAAYNGFLPIATGLTRMPPVGNQQASASSAAWAAAYAARGFYAGALEGRDINDPANLPSPSYVYHLASQGSCDDGTSIPHIVDVLRKGALSLAEQPFTPDCPPAAAATPVATARDFRVRGLRRVALKRLDDVKGELVRSNPVIVELRISAAFKRLRGDATFLETDAQPVDQGSQFVALTGYDEHRQAFRLVNSWGAGWGDHGYAWLGYEVFKARVVRAYVLDVAAPRRPAAARTSTESSTGPADLASLDALSCARIRVRADGDRRALSGFVASDADLRIVQAVAGRVPGTSVGDVDVAPWPLCEALETLEPLLTAADPPKIVVSGNGMLRAGDNLTIEVRPTGGPRYTYVSYIQADGSIIELAQPKAAGEPATTALKFGDGRDGRSRFLVGPPFGHELVIALATPQRLFEQAMPARQSARDYLTELRRVLMPSPDRPVIAASASVKIVRTQAR
jgi:hypothetical protein